MFGGDPPSAGWHFTPAATSFGYGGGPYPSAPPPRVPPGGPSIIDCHCLLLAGFGSPYGDTSASAPIETGWQPLRSLPFTVQYGYPPDVYQKMRAVREDGHLNTSWAGLPLVRDQGAWLLAQNTSLRQLGMQWQEISDLGAQYLALSPSLTYLDVGGNNIGDKGAIALAQNTRLRHLAIQTNRVSAVGLEALSKNTRLCGLVFHYHERGLQAWEKTIRDMLARNQAAEVQRRRNLFRAVHMLARAWRKPGAPFPRDITRMVLMAIAADQDFCEQLNRSSDDISILVRSALDSPAPA